MTGLEHDYIIISQNHSNLNPFKWKNLNLLYYYSSFKLV